MSEAAPGIDLGDDEAIDKAALAEFDEVHGAPKLAPITVVVAAYKEKDNIGSVVAGMPAEIDGHGVSVVVVVDGEDDGTGQVVRDAGHFACIAPVNRGQGAAL